MVTYYQRCSLAFTWTKYVFMNVFCNMRLEIPFLIITTPPPTIPLRWRHNGHAIMGVSNHQPHHCLLNRLFGCRSRKTSKLRRVTGLCDILNSKHGAYTVIILWWNLINKFNTFLCLYLVLIFFLLDIWYLITPGQLDSCTVYLAPLNIWYRIIAIHNDWRT